MVNYYREMWVQRSEIFLLAVLKSKTLSCKWREIREVFIAYPQFDKPFVIHAETSKIISQDDKPIALYSRKLSPTQTRYTTTERELLAMFKF